MRRFLREKLLQDVEGSCSGQYGFIVCVLDTMDIGRGRVVPGSGSAEFVIRYQAIVWKPFKGEVVDGVVNLVNKLGFFTDVGPLSVFVSSHVSQSSDWPANNTANTCRYEI